MWTGVPTSGPPLSAGFPDRAERRRDASTPRCPRGSTAQGSMLLSASDSKVEDLAFDNLRLARRATALEDQLHRATNPSHSSLWGLFCTTASEPASSEAPGAAANEELAAKAHENEQLHIAIYEQLRERTHKQRIEAAQRRAALAVLRAEVALLEGAAEKREEAAAAAAAAAAERDAENGAALQKLQQLCLDLRLCCATQVTRATSRPHIRPHSV